MQTTLSTTKPVGIMSAMREEMASLLEDLKNPRQVHVGLRDYFQGEIDGVSCVLAFSRLGKVASSCTATELIARFGVERILFTGVAGAIDSRLQIGDMVIGSTLVQHDLDARPHFREFEVPLLGVVRLPTNPIDSERLLKATSHFLESDFLSEISEEARRQFDLTSPKVMVGEIASGDRFFASSAATRDLKQRLPDALCVEMEGAAVAQVCSEYQIPFSIVRTISDAANEHASINYSKFLKDVASHYSRRIVLSWLHQIHANRIAGITGV